MYQAVSFLMGLYGVWGPSLNSTQGHGLIFVVDASAQTDGHLSNEAVHNSDAHHMVHILVDLLLKSLLFYGCFMSVLYLYLTTTQI